MLIASAFGDPGSGGSGGGAFAVEGSHAERIDRISSMGLACDEERLARVLRGGAQGETGAEVVIYDSRGVQRYLRLDDVSAVHDIAFDGEDVAVVSTWHNAVRWFSPAGRLLREVRYPGPADRWHLNCVTRHDGEWYATMFGPVGPLGGATPKRESAGCLVRLMTGEIVLDGLSAPHTPRRLDGLWLLCNSAKGELLAFDEQSGRIARRAKCGDWTRGVAWDERFVYVGASRRRASRDAFENAEIAVLDRTSWTTVERIVLQAQEIYDLEVISRSLYGGLRRGFDVNPYRTGEYRQYRIMSELGMEEPRTLWPSGDPLPWEDFRCSLECTVPEIWTAGSLVELPARLTNRSPSFFTSAPPAPIFVSYKWRDPATGEFLTEERACRSPLPRTIFPGESIDLTVRVLVPRVEGPAVLRITPIQEGIAWFDDLDPANGLDFAVDIAPELPTERVPAVR